MRCLHTANGKTGRTYRAENVSGLSKLDRGQVVADMRSLGDCVLVMVSYACKHGLPMRRLRVWFMACLMPLAPVEENKDMHDMAELIEHTTQQLQLPLGRFLLTPASPLYVS